MHIHIHIFANKFQMKKYILTVGATQICLLSKCIHAEPRHQAYLEYCLRVCLCFSGGVLRVVGKNFARSLVGSGI